MHADTALDHAMMRSALDLARQGRFSTSPNPRVGCVIAHGPQIVGQGFHLQAGGPHAEVHALRQAGEAARGATAYVTLEPCSHHGRTPPCAAALIKAGIKRVVVSITDPNPLVAGQGLAMLTAASIQTSCGILADEARELNRGFLSRIERGRPFVKLKLAASLDGKTALADGRSQWITGSQARADVQTLRAESCAVLTGIGTVLADNPQLNVRAFPTLRQPLRVLLDSHSRLPEHSHLVQDGLPTRSYILTDTPPAWAQHYPALQWRRLPADPNNPARIDLRALLADLAQSGIGELMLETGATLSGAFLQQNLVDEIVYYQAPKILGHHARSLFGLPENPAALTEQPGWRTTGLVPLGQDIKWVLRRNLV